MAWSIGRILARIIDALVLCCPLLTIYLPTFAIFSCNISDVSGNENLTASTQGFNFLDIVPQSAISLVSLAAFIGLSIVVALLAEKCYERLSLRDDSSDMSEHTKEILRARILGMVFGKKLQFSAMTDKQKQLELTKKYAHLWQYKAAMKKQRRKQAALQKKRKSSVWGSLFGDKDTEKSNARPPSAKQSANKGISKRPSQPSIKEVSTPPSKDKKKVGQKDFVAIDIKSDQANQSISNSSNKSVMKVSDNGVTNKATSKNTGVNIDSSKGKDEFDLANLPDNVRIKPNQPSKAGTAQSAFTKLDENSRLSTVGAFTRDGSLNKSVKPQSENTTSSSKTRPGSPSKGVSRPLTAGGSRPITAGAKRTVTPSGSKKN